MARASFSNYFKSGQKAYDWSDDDWGDFNDSVWTPEAKTPAVNVNVNGSTAYNADHSTRTDVQQNQIDNPNSPGDLAANVQNLVGSNVPTPSSVDDKSNVLLTSRDVMLRVTNELLEDLQELPSFLGCSLNKSKLNGYLRAISEQNINDPVEV